MCAMALPSRTLHCGSAEDHGAGPSERVQNVPPEEATDPFARPRLNQRPGYPVIPRHDVHLPVGSPGQAANLVNRHGAAGLLDPADAGLLFHILARPAIYAASWPTPV